MCSLSSAPTSAPHADKASHHRHMCRRTRAQIEFSGVLQLVPTRNSNPIILSSVTAQFSLRELQSQRLIAMINDVKAPPLQHTGGGACGPVACDATQSRAPSPYRNRASQKRPHDSLISFVPNSQDILFGTGTCFKFRFLNYCRGKFNEMLL